MKTIKRALSIICAFIFLCLPTFQAFAVTVEPGPDLEKATTINEYENYLSIVSKTDAELKESGMTDEDIEYIRSFSYEDEIRNRAKLSDEILEAYGYTNKEIAELRKIAAKDSIPDADIQSISTSTMESYIKVKDSGTSTEGGEKVRYIDLYYSYKWTKVPYFTMYDMVAVTFDSDSSYEYVYKQVSGNNFTKVLTEMLTGKKTTETIAWNYVKKDGCPSVNVKFLVGLDDNEGFLTHFAYQGYGTFRLTCRDTKARLYVDAVYGHSIVAVSVGYNITTKSQDFFIKFYIGMDPQHNRGWYNSDLSVSKAYVYEGDLR